MTEVKFKSFLKPIFLAIVFFGLISCNSKNTYTDQQNSQQAGDSLVDHKKLIKEINGRVLEAFQNNTIIQVNDEHAYVYAFKKDDQLEFYYELGYDSEGWPMAGEIFYFNNDKLIGYAYMSCDGCLDKDIAKRLKELKIKECQSPDDVDGWDVIWSISEIRKDLKGKANKILQKNLDEMETLESNEESISISKLTDNIYSNNENGFETFLSFKESYSDNTGIMTLSQKRCQYVYNITLEGNEIQADFFQSTCGANSSNTTLFYSSENNTISMYINGQEFVFQPVF
jgi:hypothetical protein